jgi:outer membrane protein assembly factor BamD
MVSSSCSILNLNLMKFVKSFILLLLITFVSQSYAISPGGGNLRKNGSNSDDKEFLFPGTGFFKKNRDPISDEQSRFWFDKAAKAERNGDLKKALDLYENFSKRRSDLRINSSGKVIQVGPESLYRAAKIREDMGDWQKAFSRLRLIAEAYTDYDFERVAESLMRIAERLANDKLPRKWGVLPRFRSGSQDRLRLNQIASLARGPRFAPRALMALSEIAIKDKKEDEAIDALERLINLYPDNYLCEEAYFVLAKIFEDRVAGPAYDQGATLKALNFYEDYLILYPKSPLKSKHETLENYQLRLTSAKQRKSDAEEGRRKMRETLSASKVVVGKYVEKYGKYFLTHWRELGNKPALQFYNEAITTAPESKAAREAEKKVAELRSGNE